MISDRQLLQKLGASVANAFYGGFQELREIQRQALIPMLEGNNVLLASATASGKTEAIFAPLIARLLAHRNLPSRDIRILAVAPTRALVNDLHKRLETPLSQLSWTCGRQTADCSDKNRRPHVLITTPESFDSMLVRGAKWGRGVLVDHLLASIRAVFLDEAHLYLSSPRGDQIVWLLARLRRLLNFAVHKSWRPFPDLQICAASATISHPQEIAAKLLGEGAKVVQVAGSRELEILSPSSEKRWEKIANMDSTAEIYQHIRRVAGTSDLSTLTDHIWDAIEKGDEEYCRKVLVFVPTRAICDKLSTVLADDLGKRRRMFIAGHHASLGKEKREYAEQEFARRRDAILVATTTLEVGIDIGDVDVVALVGPPPDTSSFLQRVGRAGRRSDCVRIVAVARNELEARAFASLLFSACRGELEKVYQGRRWSVFVQQAASFVAQSGKRGRRRSDLLQLAENVWEETSGSVADRILEHLLAEGLLIEQRDRLFLGESFMHRLEEGRGSFHHNFESEANGLPVIDACTGEVVARISDLPTSDGPVVLAGQSWDYNLVAGEVILKPSADKKPETSFRYAARAAPTKRIFAEHVRAGLGLAANETPVISWKGKEFWFHFGGFAYERVLLILHDNLKYCENVRGIAVLGRPNQTYLKNFSNRPQDIYKHIELLAPRLSLGLSLGKYHKFLPEDVQVMVIRDLFEIDNFIDWLNSIKLIKIDPSHHLFQILVSIIQDN